MVSIRRATVRDVVYVGRFVDALLMELSGPPSRYDERVETADRLLALRDRIFGFLAFQSEEPVALMMISESAAMQVGYLASSQSYTSSRSGAPPEWPRC